MLNSPCLLLLRNQARYDPNKRRYIVALPLRVHPPCSCCAIKWEQVNIYSTFLFFLRNQVGTSKPTLLQFLFEFTLLACSCCTIKWEQVNIYYCAPSLNSPLHNQVGYVLLRNHNPHLLRFNHFGCYCYHLHRTILGVLVITYMGP